MIVEKRTQWMVGSYVLPDKLKYLGGYSESILCRVRGLIEQDRLQDLLLEKYSCVHEVRTSKALYGYVMGLKNQFMRSSVPLSKVTFDNKLRVIKHALGTHTAISRIQGRNLKSKREIRVAALFKEVPLPLLRMISVHELAHLREQAHDKAFYQLCTHMEPDYHQLEFDLRLYLTWLDQPPGDSKAEPLWALGHP